MKRNMLIIAVILSSFVAKADVYKFKCFEDMFYDLSLPNSKQMNWQSVDVLVLINTGDNKIRVFTNSEFNIDIIQYLPTETLPNGDKRLNYVGVDQDGKKCNCSITIYQDQSSEHIATLNIEYSNFIYYFRLKKNS